MAREIVTSGNRQEYMEKKLGASPESSEDMKDPQLYKHYAKQAESLSNKANTNMSHYDAMNAHKHAAMYAKPNPVYKEHEKHVLHHAEKMRTAKKIEAEQHVSEFIKNRSESQERSMKNKGFIASS